MPQKSKQELIEEIWELRQQLSALEELSPIGGTREDKSGETIFQTLFDSSPSGIMLEDEFGKILRVNQAFCELMGYSREELVGQNVRMFSTEENLPRVDANIKRILSGQVLKFIEQSKRKDGSICYVQLNERKILLPGGEQGIISISVDMTKQFLAEQELQKSNERYQNLITLLPFATLVHSKGIVRYLNPAAVQAFGGKSEKEFIGRKVLDFIHPEFIDSISKRMEAVYNNDGTMKLKREKLLALDGKTIHVDLQVTHVEFEGEPASLVVFADVGELVQSEKAVRESEQKFRTIVENSHSGITLIDGAFHLMYSNQQFSEITGYSTHELSSMDFRVLLDDESRSLVSERYRKRQRGEPVPSRYDFYILRKDKSLRRVEIRSAVVQDSSGLPMTIAQVLDVTEQRQAENALQKSEEQYRVLAETANDFILMHDMDGVITYANRAAIEQSGWGDALIGLKITKIVPQVELQGLEQRYRQRVQNDETRLLFEREAITKSGQKIPMEVSSTLIKESGQPAAVLLVARDITFRKKAEAALKQSEQKYKHLVDNSLAGIYITQNHIIKFCNEKFVEIFRYGSVQEMLGMHVRDLVAAESWELVDNEVKARETGKKVISRYEFKCVCKDGAICDVEVLGGSIQYQGAPAVQGTMINISERKKAQEQINRLATVVEQAVESIVITDIEGTIQYVNPAFKMVTGYDPHEAIGKNPRILKSGKHSAAFYQDLWATILKGKKWQGIIINKRKNGKIYYEKAVIFPITETNGDIINFAAIMRDITLERKLEIQLQQVQKMESIGTLAGGIAHDFNNLLTVINGHAEIAMLHTPQELKAYKNLLSILKAGKRAEKLTNQLLAFSRKQLHELKVIEINALIKELDKMLRRLIPADIRINYNLAESLPFVKADTGQIEQILINLVVNARDAINEHLAAQDKKTIAIETASVELDAEFCRKHPGSREGTYIAIRVKDSGIGIDEDYKTRVFEPFFTTKEVGKGTGLGLATVYGIVKQNDGYIEVDSIKNAGSVFSIYWPVTTEAPTPELVHQLNESSYKGEEEILLVEDDEGVRNFTSEALNNFGYRVHQAMNGTEAITMLKEQQLKVDLVITDIIMPEINGKEFINKISQSLNGTEVLFVSGYTYEHLLNDGALEAGINFLQKPYSIQSLLKNIRKILDQQKIN